MPARIKKRGHRRSLDWRNSYIAFLPHHRVNRREQQSWNARTDCKVLDRRDQRAVCFAARAARRPFPPLDDARSASQTARSSRAGMVQGRRSGGFSLRPGGGRCARLRSARRSSPPPLHLPRSPTADRSLKWIFRAPSGAVRLAVPAIPACVRLPPPARILSAGP